MRSACPITAAFVVALATSPGVARADEPSPSTSSSPVAPSPPPSSKRTMPDYDGRGPRPTTAGEVALWGPRVLLSPLYFVSEWLIRRPLGAAITAAERADLPNT
jgi:hypothetical protein